MANVKKKKKKKTVKRQYAGTVNPNLKSYANDPFFLKKAEQAKEFLRKHGVPEGFPPFEG